MRYFKNNIIILYICWLLIALQKLRKTARTVECAQQINSSLLNAAQLSIAFARC